MTTAHDDIAAQTWDVIVIGTGIGGGTAGRALAEAGFRTLFAEKGPAGRRAEQTALDPAIADPAARAVRGFWPGRLQPITAAGAAAGAGFFAPLGAGVGGSSVFYAATLERPEPHDLDTTPDCPHPAGGWPVSFAAFLPWLERAEALYHVSGDPYGEAGGTPAPGPSHIAPPPPFSPADRRIAARLAARGLHPYHLRSAIRRLPGCLDCAGHKCPRACKMDGRSAGVEPALATGRAALLDGTEITRIVADGSRVTHLEARRHGIPLTLRARAYVLAGGALGSPRLCLGSASESAPQGIANSSGLVGRGLMFHLNEMFALWPGGGDPAPSKAIGLRDLCRVDGTRLGMVQSMGLNASYGEIAWHLERRLARPLAHLAAAAAARLLGSAKIFVGLLEDLAYDDNRVLPPAPCGAPDDIAFTYRIHDELLARRRQFRRAISRAFRGQPRLFLGHAPELNHGHPSGTMRFGTDPARSVLDPDGRAHDLRNLWVADASFMPSSMGVNPSLTIAAQALRVADAIARNPQEDTP